MTDLQQVCQEEWAKIPVKFCEKLTGKQLQAFQVQAINRQGSYPHMTENYGNMKCVEL